MQQYCSERSWRVYPCAHAAARQLLAEPGLPAANEGGTTSASDDALQAGDIVIAIPTHQHRHWLLPSSRASRQVSMHLQFFSPFHHLPIQEPCSSFA